MSELERAAALADLTRATHNWLITLDALRAARAAAKGHRSHQAYVTARAARRRAITALEAAARAYHEVTE